MGRRVSTENVDEYKDLAVFHDLQGDAFPCVLSRFRAHITDVSIQALRIYPSKDLIEKTFNDLKDRLSMRRTSVSSEENLEGKLFLQYIGLIYLSYVKQAMDKAGLFKKYTALGIDPPA